MFFENVFPVVLLAAALLCTLVAGFILLFAIVVMPGLGGMSSRDFLRSFQMIDGVIQNNQPLFLVVWVGSVLSLSLAAILSIWQLEGINRVLVVSAAVIYLVGVQLPTFTVNIPLNNHVQTLNLVTAEDVSCDSERQDFEETWNRWNVIRTVFACVVSVMLLTILRLL